MFWYQILTDYEDDNDGDGEEDKDEDEEEQGSRNDNSSVHVNALKRVVSRGNRGVLISSYEGLRRRKDDLCAIKWSYAILDEGHRIRNPDAEVNFHRSSKSRTRLVLGIEPWW